MKENIKQAAYGKRCSGSRKRTRRGVWFVTLFLVILGVSATVAQTAAGLRLIDVDTAAFPLVNVTLLVGDGRTPPRDSLDGLVLRENGTPIDTFTAERVPRGLDVVLVIDANDTFNQIDDDSGLTRQEKVRESIARFATQSMRRDGRDSVSIIVPDAAGESGRFLVQDASEYEAVAAAIEAYAPEELRRDTPLNAMLSQALAHLQQKSNDGRFQAVLLFTDGGRIAEQLDFPQLVAQANAANAAVYVAILGARADPNEIEAAARLYEPTQGFFVHLLEPADATEIYSLWQQQGEPWQVTYRSPQRTSGQVDLSLNLDAVQLDTSYTISLAAPELTLQPGSAVIQRSGSAPDTPLDELQPTIQPLTLTVAWPDNQPRRLEEIVLRANGAPQPQPPNLALDETGAMTLNWDISAMDAGAVELVAEVTDELGYTATSALQTVEIAVSRPLPPTATAVPAAETAPPLTLSVPDWALPAAALGGVLVLATAVFLWRRRRAAGEASLPPPENDAPETAAAPEVTAVLERQDSPQRLTLSDDSVTIGRDGSAARLVVDDATVARLHARVRRSGGTFWLYDEGSSEGTYLNYERLGLAPRPLQHGDVVQFGRVTFRFRILPEGETAATVAPAAEAPQNSEESE